MLHLIKGLIYGFVKRQNPAIFLLMVSSSFIYQKGFENTNIMIHEKKFQRFIYIFDSDLS
jgi:hypothetical protein